MDPTAIIALALSAATLVAAGLAQRAAARAPRPVPAPFYARVRALEGGGLAIETPASTTRGGRRAPTLPHGVRAGDTVVLSGVAIPRVGSRGGRGALGTLKRLVAGQIVAIYPSGRTPQGDLAAQVFAGDRDLAAVLMVEGHGTSIGSIPLLRLERSARARKVGMWAAPEIATATSPASRLTLAQRRERLLAP